MALPYIFANESGNQPASQLDANFNAVAAMGIRKCTASGTNTVALTSSANQPASASYVQGEVLEFVPAAAPTGAVVVNRDTIGEIRLYYGDGVTQVGSSGYTINQTLLITYDAALNSGNGGFIWSGSAAASSQLAQGFVNKFRNSQFEIASRGLSGSVTTGAANYTLDGWIVGATGATATWSQGQSTSGGNAFGTLPVPFSPFYLTITGNTSMTDTFFRQRIEGDLAACLTGQVVTVTCSFLNSSGSPITPNLTVKHAGTIDNWGAPVTYVNAVSLQTIASGAYGNLSYTFTDTGAAYLGLEVTVDIGAALNSNAKSIVVGAADIRLTPGAVPGLNSSPPQPEIRPYSYEFEMNQRYLPAFGSVVGPVGTGAATSTSASGYFLGFVTPPRINPTGLTIGTAGDFEIADLAGTDVAALTGMIFSKAGPAGAFVTATVSGTPLTSTKSYLLYVKTALAGNLIFTGAEL